MSKSVKITRDACGADLTTSTNSVDWRLALVNEPIPPAGGNVTAAMKYRVIEGDRYFCGIPCLREWFYKAYSQEDSK